MKDKIIILQRILPHYRVGFFKKLIKLYPSANVVYGNPVSGESLENSDVGEEKNFIKVKNYYLNRSGSVFFSGIYKLISSHKPDILISSLNLGSISNYLIFLFRHFFNYKIIFWTFGYDPFKGFAPGKRLRDKVRLYFFQKADAVIFYWERGFSEVKIHSKKSSHYFIAPNTLDTQQLTKYRAEMEREGREKIKKELGIKEKNHFVYIGRLIKDKQVDLLLRSFEIIEAENKSVRLSIIGDGPELKQLKELVKKLKLMNVHFLGEILDEKIAGKWIYASDAFVMPGRLGLSVVHSFCFGTPVISQKKESYFHGEGIGYLRDGENGILTEDGNEKDFAKKMSEVGMSNEFRSKLSMNAIKTIELECSIDMMVNGFSEAIRNVRAK